QASALPFKLIKKVHRKPVTFRLPKSPLFRSFLSAFTAYLQRTKIMTAPQTFPYDIFLSHNKAQKAWTLELARRLRDDGFEVWFDEWVLPRHGGGNWIQLLREGIKASRKAALVWSPEFFANQWPEFE